MSQDIGLPGARVPFVDAKGCITKEWSLWIVGMFARVGGSQGFSNAELYGDAVALQSYDELLERIGALEAQNRSLGQAVQMLAIGQMDQSTATPPIAVTPDTFSRIKVLGETDLATDRGSVRVGLGVPSSTAKLQVGGDADISGGARVRGAFQVDGEAKAAAYRVGDRQVVSARQTGISAYGAYSGQSVDTYYNPAQAQTTDNAISAASTKLAQVVTALRAHGLIGD